MGNLVFWGRGDSTRTVSQITCDSSLNYRVYIYVYIYMLVYMYCICIIVIYSCV